MSAGTIVKKSSSSASTSSFFAGDIFVVDCFRFVPLPPLLVSVSPSSSSSSNSDFVDLDLPADRYTRTYRLSQ
jgi:hypothetical protein